MSGMTTSPKTTNHASIAEQKRAGVGGKFGAKTSSAPKGSLTSSRGAGALDVPEGFPDVWLGPSESEQEAYGYAVLAHAPRDEMRVTALHHGSQETVRVLQSDMRVDEAATHLGVSDSVVASTRSDFARMQQRAAASVAVAKVKGIRLRTQAEGGIPERLNDLGDYAPTTLWTQGDDSLLDSMDESTCVTGARAATAYGETAASEITAALTRDDRPLVTGLAYGADGAATRAALAQGSPVIGFVANGVDRVYPAGHAALFGLVAKNGLLVSQEPPGQAPTKFRMMARSRLMAASAARTVVVEAGSRSGARMVSDTAGVLGRDVYAVPGPITSASSTGTNEMIQSGQAKLLDNNTLRELAG